MVAKEIMQRFLLVFGLLIFLGQAQPGQQSALAFDTDHSKMTVYVDKEGLFSFAADNHEVNVPIASGSFDPQTLTAQVTIDARRMIVLDPPSRQDKVQANMDGPQVLDIEHYPTITFRSTHINMVDTTHWSVTGDLTLHGQTHPVDVSVIRNGANNFDGSATIKQTDFGITPITLVGGTVRVKDDVKVEFNVVLK